MLRESHIKLAARSCEREPPTISYYGGGNRSHVDTSGLEERRDGEKNGQRSDISDKTHGHNANRARGVGGPPKGLDSSTTKDVRRSAEAGASDIKRQSCKEERGVDDSGPSACLISRNTSIDSM